MNRISRLSPVVADQIAAGEVVERPASVVKELVENALDAHATRITVLVEEGGLGRIVVDDDGEGILPEDVPLAVERYATSKLRVLNDLWTLTSLGFRGEALAAVAAVSHLTLTSRHADSRHGVRVTVDHGRTLPPVPHARSVGTRVEVTGLFHAVPARLKAMKTPGAEAAAIHQLLIQTATAFPEVAMNLAIDGMSVLESTGSGNLLETIRQVAGPAAATGLIPVSAVALSGAITVEGVVASPTAARGNRQLQVMTVNRRIIRNWSLRASVEQAYGHMLGERKYPLFWLQIMVPPEDVDPNAHPTKAEVRLTRERALAGLLYSAVSDALQESRAFPLEAGVQARETTGTYETDASPQLDLALDGAEPGLGPVLAQEIADLVPLGQWAARYILAQGRDGLYLIDQHAAHERVYYDRLRRAEERDLTAQPLLVPLVLTLTPREVDALNTHGPALKAAGFDLDWVGSATVAVREVPAALIDVADLTMVSVLFQALGAEGWTASHPVSWMTDHLLATAACKAAVKASRGLAREEMAGLLQMMARTESPRSCPHGRPTLLVIGLEEVDRRFGRR